MTRVLIVDDKEENLYYLQALLTGHGEQVDTARHGAEALVKARQRPPDIIVSDLLMPVMDGYTLLRHWKMDPRLRKIPFIVYTATYTEAEDERLARSLGADAFILKPAEPDEFLTQLRDVRSRVATASANIPQLAPAEENRILKSYSETLIRKLEEKTLQLQQTNRDLERDIAERKAVEATLREREAELRLLTETIPHIVWITRGDGAHTHFNQRWLEHTGLTLAQSLETGWIEAIHPADRARTITAWQQSVTRGERYEIEHRIRRTDGSYSWMLGRALPLRDASGTIVKWFGTCTDIDELKRAQSRIEEQAALLDQTQDAIIVRDLKQRVLYWNKGAERIYGWTATEALGRSVCELFYRDRGQFTHAMETLLRRGEWSGELRHVNKSGQEIAIEARWSLLRDGGGSPRSVLAINTDVTERKKIEAQFLRAQRVESIGTLAGGLAHDLNNLLSPIVLSVSLLRDALPDGPMRKVVDTVEQSAHRGTHLVQQVLSFARGVEGAHVAVHLSDVVREIETIMQTTFPKNVTFSSHLPPDLWLVRGDPTQLSQILLNLCVNARDAMLEGGRLRISAQNRALDEQEAAAHPVIKPGRYVTLEVSDTGVGMGPEIVERIFEPFFTTKELGKGTGLGLSAVRGIVRSHGGTISVHSTPGRGSTFRILLPAQEEAGAPLPVRAPAERIRGNGEVILVVDDEASILQVTQETLQLHGYRVLTAVDGAQAMALFALRRAEINLVLTDLMMPVMDGYAFIAALQRIEAKVPVIAVSGVGDEVSGQRLARGGVHQVLTKPFSAESLLAAIARGLAEAKPKPS
jgi:PAS domain S-box-containing protein